MYSRPNLTEQDYVRLAAFRFALRRFLRFSELAAKRAGLTAQHYQALLALRGSATPQPMTINDLAKQLLIQHNSAVGLVDRLVEQRLLRRQAAREDARKVRLALTAKGLRVVEKVANWHREELGQSGPEIGRVLAQIAAVEEAGRLKRRTRRPRRKAA